MAIFSDDENIQKPLDINKKAKSEDLETKETPFDKSFENNISFLITIIVDNTWSIMR